MESKVVTSVDRFVSLPAEIKQNIWDQIFLPSQEFDCGHGADGTTVPGPNLPRLTRHSLATQIFHSRRLQFHEPNCFRSFLYRLNETLLVVQNVVSITIRW